MAKIEIQDSGVRAHLEALERNLKNRRPVMAEISEIMLQSVRENFRAQGRPRWRDLSDVTKKIRTKKRRWPGKILDRGGAYGLKGSINARYTNDSAIVGTNKPYAPTMQYGAKAGEFGTVSVKIKAHKRKKKGGKRKSIKVKEHTRDIKTPWGDIPSRPFLVLQIEDENAINKAITKYIFEYGVK